MRRPDAVAAALEKRSVEEIAAWLARGFHGWAGELRKDPFHPHSIYDLYGERPAEAIEEIYAVASEKVQDGLQLGVEKLARMCRAKCPESSRLSAEQRWNLLREVTRLCTELICFRCADTLAKIAAEDADYWKREYPAADVYSKCLAALEDIAIQFDESAFAARAEGWRDQVEQSLGGLVLRKGFSKEFAPRLLYSLLCVTPRRFIHHLDLLGRHVATLFADPGNQSEYAYKTAKRIASKALVPLIEHFSRFDLAEEGGRDVWLAHALFHRAGPLRYQKKQSATVVLAAYHDQPDSPFPLEHSALASNGPLMAHIAQMSLTRVDLLKHAFDVNVRTPKDNVVRMANYYASRGWKT